MYGQWRGRRVGIEERLDRRRSGVGLPTMDEYVKMVGEGFDFDVVWDKTIDVEALNRMRSGSQTVVEEE